MSPNGGRPLQFSPPLALPCRPCANFGNQRGERMRQAGEYRIGAAREEVWRALNDPDVLARCIDGCEAMTRVGEDAYKAVVKARVGPLSATFDADVTLA